MLILSQFVIKIKTKVMHHFVPTGLITVFIMSISMDVFSQNDSIAKADSVLLKQIEQQLNNTEPTPPPATGKNSSHHTPGYQCDWRLSGFIQK